MQLVGEVISNIEAHTLKTTNHHSLLQPSNRMANKIHLDPHRGKLLDILIRCPQRGQSNLLGELSKAGVTKQGNMAEQLVTDIRLRGVHWFGTVTDVLGGMEYPECESSKEVTRGQQA